MSSADLLLLTREIAKPRGRLRPKSAKSAWLNSESAGALGGISSLTNQENTKKANDRPKRAQREKWVRPVDMTLDQALQSSKNFGNEHTLDANLITQLRQRISSTKQQWDRAKSQAVARKKELERLKVELQEVDGRSVTDLSPRPDAAATSAKPHLDRSKSLATSISRLSFQAPQSSGIGRLEQQLDDSTLRIAHYNHRTGILEHMKTRLRANNVKSERETAALVDDVNGWKKGLENEEALQIRTQRVLSNKRNAFKKMEEETKRQIQLWQRETEWTKLKMKTKHASSAVLAQQASKEHRIHQEIVEGDLSKVEEQKLKKKNVAEKFLTQFTEARTDLPTMMEEEKVYDAAFQKLDASLNNLDCERISGLVNNHEEYEAEMEEKRLQMVLALEEAQDRVHDLTHALQELEYDTQRTSNQTLVQKEDECRVAEKKAKAMKEEWDYLIEQMKPVQVGIRALALQLVDEHLVPDNVDDLDQLERCVDLFELEIKSIGSSIEKMQSKRPENSIKHFHTLAMMHAMAHGNTSGIEVGVAAMAPSQFNIRVKSLSEIEADESTTPLAKQVVPDFHPAMKQQRSSAGKAANKGTKQLNLNPGNVDVRGFVVNQGGNFVRKEQAPSSSESDSCDDEDVIDRQLMKTRSMKLLAKKLAGPVKQKKKKKELHVLKSTTASRSSSSRKRTPLPDDFSPTSSSSSDSEYSDESGMDNEAAPQADPSKCSTQQITRARAQAPGLDVAVTRAVPPSPLEVLANKQQLFAGSLNSQERNRIQKEINNRKSLRRGYMA